MVAWPADVPQLAMTDSYGEDPQENVVRFKPSVGPELLRRRSSMSMTELRFATMMTHDQYDSLIDFWRDDLADGSLRFTRKHPRDLGGADVTMQFLSKPNLSGRGPDFGVVTLAMLIVG